MKFPSAGNLNTYNVSCCKCRESFGAVIKIDACIARLSSRSPNQDWEADICQATPFGRWNVDATSTNVSHKLGSRFGQFLDDVENFDAATFGVSPSEALVLDPQQRLMLEVKYMQHSKQYFTLDYTYLMQSAVL